MRNGVPVNESSTQTGKAAKARKKRSFRGVVATYLYELKSEARRAAPTPEVAQEPVKAA
jgi:hypothetical protein